MPTKTKQATFASRLRELRINAGLTQAQLAERAGLGSQAIPRLERGEREPTWETACLLADALAIDVGKLRQ